MNLTFALLRKEINPLFLLGWVKYSNLLNLPVTTAGVNILFGSVVVVVVIV
jgi:hypothetical protein